MRMGTNASASASTSRWSWTTRLATVACACALIALTARETASSSSSATSKMMTMMKLSRDVNEIDADDAEDADAETALSREIARVNTITRDITAPGLMATLRVGLARASRASSSPADAARPARDDFASACATLAAASAMELLARTTMNLIGRRAYLDRACGREEDTLDDASRRAYLCATTERFASGGARELLEVARAVVERELGREGDVVDENGWTRDDAEAFMRRCRETMSRALLVPSDVFSDPKALPFERARRLHVNAPRSFPSWEAMLLPEKNPDFNLELGPVSTTGDDGRDDDARRARERQVSNLRDVLNETRLVVRSPHFVVAMNDAMHAAWRAHADAVPLAFFGNSREGRLSVERCARACEATAARMTRDGELGLLSAISNESGVVFFGDAVW